MFRRANNTVVVISAVVIVARYLHDTLAFQQMFPASIYSRTFKLLLETDHQNTISFQSSASGRPRQLLESRIEESNSNYCSHRKGCNNAADDPCLLSRRKVVSGAFSFATMASWCPVKETGASPLEKVSTPSSTLSAKPFRVLFMVQIDSQKPEDLSALEIEVRPDWAPLAAERFRTLVELGFYKDAPFFRVLPGYVAQFGISSDPNLNKQWVYCDTTDEGTKRGFCQPNLPDEPRTQPNKKGTLSFASSGKNSRKTQIFINLANNDGPPNFLDAQNFVPFARIVVRGVETENNTIPWRLNAQYGGKVNQGKAAYYGGEYFQTVFPSLSIIRDAKII